MSKDMRTFGYICPECGEEIDLSEQIPEITKKTIEIC